MCGTDKEDVSMLQVAPATWNGFHDFAEVCAECQTSRRFKMWAKARVAKSNARPSSTGIQDAPLPALRGEEKRPASVIRIAHRRTGVLLREVESHTLAGVNLVGAALSGADLQNATLRNTDLHRADLHLADLAGADLRGADLRGVNFRGADLRGADLRDARLYKADLNHALYDAGTQWPAGFDPDTCGAQKNARVG
jgi:hypothetical protein